MEWVETVAKKEHLDVEAKAVLTYDGEMTLQFNKIILVPSVYAVSKTANLE